MVNRLAITDRDPTTLEKEIAKYLDDMTNAAKKDVKKDLKRVQVAGAKEFTINQDGVEVQKILLIYVSYPSLAATQRHSLDIISTIQNKKGIVTFITAKRTILSKWIKKHKSQMRPRNRTLTSVHDSILDDLIAPATITARRIRYRGNKHAFFRITINEEAKNYLESRVEPIKFIYKVLTNRVIDIDFKSEPNYHVNN